MEVFRENDDCDLVGKLVKLSLSDDKTTRGLATIILANVADNTTLPLITNALKEGPISINSLTNLLGVVRIKADYALADNRELIGAAIRSVRERAKPERDSDIQKLTEEIESELRKSTSPDKASERFGRDYCVPVDGG